MKRTLLLFAICLIYKTVAAQGGGNILSITVNPPNPTIADSVYIDIACMFNSGGCPVFSVSTNQNGNSFSTSMHHCLGFLSVICNATNTVVLPPMPAGNYTLHAELLVGFGGPSCTPGIAPSDADSVNFTVSGPQSFIDRAQGKQVHVFAANGNIGFIGLDDGTGSTFFELYNLQGKRVFQFPINKPYISADGLAPGLYLYVLKTNGEITGSGKLPVE